MHSYWTGKTVLNIETVPLYWTQKCFAGMDLLLQEAHRKGNNIRLMPRRQLALALRGGI